ncbi:hypothetical protein ACFFOP_28370, partial [Sinosporangium siamense]
MRILFTSYADKSHFLGMAPLAWALHIAGHEVRVASQPELTGTITHAGLTAVPVGTDHRLRRISAMVKEKGAGLPAFELADVRPEKLTWEYLSWGYRSLVPWWWRVINNPMIADLTDFCRYWRPDLVIWEPISFAGPIAAKASGAAHARFMWGLDVFARMRAHYVRLRDEQPEQRREDSLAEWIGSQGAQFGVEFTEDMTTGHFTLDYTPPSMRFDLDYHHVPLRYVPYNGTGT